MIHLVITRGPDAPRRQTFLEFPILIGRDPSNSMILSDPEVSRQHIQIKRRGNLFIISDSGSKNGCYINGERTVNSIIQNGDKILLGNTEILFATSTELINFAADIINFNMIIDQEQGISGPISVSSHQSEEKTNSHLRLTQSSILNKITTLVDHQKIFESHSDIIVTQSLDEAAQATLKALCKIENRISRSAFFVWSKSNKQLIPIAANNSSSENKKTYLLHTSSFQQVINRKQGLVLEGKKNQPNARHRIVLPMLKEQDVICIVHCEIDRINENISISSIESLSALLAICSPKFESLLLRKEIDAMMLGMVETMVATIEAKDTYTQGHSERVCRYSMAIAEELKLNSELKKMLMISALCHDIGKIGIPDAILKKAALLSREEYEEMKLHPTIGAEIIANLPNAERFISGIKYHHEKWDGTGYPEGLMGEDIPFFGRIVAVSDVFDAMVSGRSYSGFIDESDAIEKIQKEIDLFDPEIVKALVKAFEKGMVTQRTSTLGKAKDPLGKDSHLDESDD